MTLEEIGLVVIGGAFHIFMGVEVEYSALVCNHCVYISVIVISSVYVIASTISICSLRVLEEEQPQ